MYGHYGNQPEAIELGNLNPQQNIDIDKLCFKLHSFQICSQFKIALITVIVKFIFVKQKFIGVV